MRKHLYSIYLLIVLFLNPVLAVEKGLPRTAILGAFDEEVLLIQQQLKNIDEKKIEGIKFVQGDLHDRRIVVAWTGTGKVNAAATTTLLIEHFRPDELIFTGIAGGINTALSPGDIVIAEKTAQHDYGRLTAKGLENRGMTNPVNGKRNPVFYPACPRLLTLAEHAADQTVFDKIECIDGERLPKVIKGIVVTGDIFVASTVKCDELRERLGADAVEMEGAAVAQLCHQQNVPCIIIRSLSDKADEKAIEDIDKFYKMAAKNSAALVTTIVQLLQTSPPIDANIPDK